MRFLLTVLAVGLIALSGASRGRADPGQSSPDCGDWNDTGGRFYLWDQVKKRTPTDRGTNLEVVFPDPARDYGYAVHNGAHGAPSTYDLLLLPTNRVSGIECPKIWAPNALNLWQYARDAARRIPSGNNIALGINSAELRDQDQLHIHVSRIFASAKTDIDNQRKLITNDPANWRGTVISVQGTRTFVRCTFPTSTPTCSHFSSSTWHRRTCLPRQCWSCPTPSAATTCSTASTH